LVCARIVAGASTSLNIPSLRIEAGSVTMIEGPANSENNLLLRVLGLLEAPDAGEIVFEGQSTAGWTEEQRAELRARRCGYVFASPFLLSKFTVLENIAMPLFKTSNMDVNEVKDRTEDVLDFAGLQKLATTRDIPLAVQQRVALARALAPRPAAVFVEDFAPAQDEAGGFRDLLHQSAERYGLAVVASVLAESAPRVGERRLRLSGGRVASEVMP
jgi:predicted ABC-type transport system involved in lysophospholipase L1 biosynthesis ATPase subunit